ncbi:hypothetical protein NMG60_11017425 [Bertholletia excelsa]
MGAIGWYGPLIDLSKATSHIGDYVQLLVFVHRSTAVQYKLSRGGEVIRTDIQVGDETRPFFSVSIWQKQMKSIEFAGAIVLLEIVEARTVQHSSLQCLIHPNASLVSEGANDNIKACQIGPRTKEKLQKVIEWVQQTGSTFHTLELRGCQYKRQKQLINWKVHEERDPQDCFSLSELSGLAHSCQATFYASIGEIFLSLTWKHFHKFEEERMFISRRLCVMGDIKLAEDLICTGCQLCGSLLNSESGSAFDQRTIPLYCPKSSNHLHLIRSIYRPFMLYVWDDTKCIPLLVTNKAAELLFGNVDAERVYECYSRQKHGQTPKRNHVQNTDHDRADTRTVKHPNVAESEVLHSVPPCLDKSSRRKEKQKSEGPNFYLIWLALLKVLVQQGKNSPLKFKVRVNVSRDPEDGRFEMISVSMPCC